MSAAIFAMPGNETLASELAALTGVELGVLEHRKFPDGETYLRFGTEVRNRTSLLACSLHNPNVKVLPLLLAAAALRDLSAATVGLVAPYLAYMRQDRRFKDGEAVTSSSFARLLSSAFNWIATIDPHLHRLASPGEIYTIPVLVGHAAPLLADYLRRRPVPSFLVGPDAESEQWVSAVASAAHLPHVTLQKDRRGDRDVSISFPSLTRFTGMAPILVDDIVSSGRTMEMAVKHLVGRGFRKPICLAVHGILAEDARDRLVVAGAEIVTTNTVPGPMAKLNINPLLAELIRPQLLKGTKP